MNRTIYIHIPKTGGSTMRQIMTNNLGKDHVFAVGSRHAVQIPWFFALPQEKRDEYRHALGHFRYGIHTLFSSGGASYFTILRHPIERTLSAYSFALETTTLPHHEAVKAMSFSQYLREMKVTEVMTSWLMGYLPGATTPVCYGVDAPLPPDSAQIVIKRLSEEFVLTGMLEHYDESLLMLQDIFKWKDVYYYRGNVTSKRLKYKDLSAEDKRAIDALAGPDFEVFEWARAQFQERLEVLGEPFQQRLAEFRKRNAIVGERRRKIRKFVRRVRKFLHIEPRLRNQPNT